MFDVDWLLLHKSWNKECMYMNCYMGTLSRLIKMRVFFPNMHTELAMTAIYTHADLGLYWNICII